MNKCLYGDCRDSMRSLISEGVRVHCVITSPPYYGLRDYGCEGQLGLEKTPEEYISNMVEIFQLVRELLRDDGTLWLNMGDSYAGSGRGLYGDGTSHGTEGEKQLTNFGSIGVKIGSKEGDSGHTHGVKPPNCWGLKPKDLIMMPARLAIALQGDGWYLRSDIIWSKMNPMPESVTDRPTTAHEHIFLLSKYPRYYYDAVMPNTRNKRSVWEIPTAPYNGAHFATYPPALITPCILAGTSEKGCCPICGAPWERILEKGNPVPTGHGASKKGAEVIKQYRGEKSTETSCFTTGCICETKTIGWRPTCKCGNPETVPAIVFDPFLGSGTTGMVAEKLGRHWLGCELNEKYKSLIDQRTAQVGMHL